jgi:nitrate/nitrite transporter NarK
MNTNIEAQIIGMAQSARAVGKDVYEFAQKQAPELCKEIVAWNLWENGFYAAVFGVAIAFSIWLTWRCYCRFVDDERLIALPPAALAVCLMIPFTSHTSDAMKSIVAPRLVIIEAIGKVVK